MWACSRNTTNLSVPGSEGDNQAEDPQKDTAGRTEDLTHSDAGFPQAEVPDTPSLKCMWLSSVSEWDPCGGGSHWLLTASKGSVIKLSDTRPQPRDGESVTHLLSRLC